MKIENGLKTFTIAEYADAIERNGLKQARGVFFKGPGGLRTNIIDLILDSKIDSACALGQAVVNLGIGVNWRLDSNIDRLNMALKLQDMTIQYNDDAVQQFSFKEVADHIRYMFKDQLDYEFTVPMFDYSTVEFPEGFHAG